MGTRPAGETDKSGGYPDGSVFGLAAARLAQFNAIVRAYLTGSSL